MPTEPKPRRERGAKAPEDSTPKPARRRTPKPAAEPTVEPSSPSTAEPREPAPKPVRRRPPRPKPGPDPAPSTTAEPGAAELGATEPTASLPRESASAAPEPAPARRRRVVITGGNGFVGRAVVRALRERGDEVIALVRDPRRAPDLAELGVELVADDLSDVGRLTERLRELAPDAVIHAAGSYRVGIRRDERGAMWDANVGTTTRILDAAEAAGTPRIVYVSTCNVFGNTRGRVVDETYRRDLAEDFLSWYDETKYGAHEVAEQRIASGAPVVIVQPSQVYGPGDASAVGDQLRRAHAGNLRSRALDDVGLGMVHADDLARGILAALDHGEPGRSYVLSGPTTSLGEAIAVAARLGGHEPPRLRVPTALLRALAPIGRLVGQPNLAEVVSASAGVTYWASSARAAEELGFEARQLEDGLRDTFGG